MGDVVVRINSAAARALLNSEAMQAECLRHAERVAAECESRAVAEAAAHGVASTGNFVADVRPGRNRAHAMVKTASYWGARTQAKTDCMARALDGGG